VNATEGDRVLFGKAVSDFGPNEIGGWTDLNGSADKLPIDDAEDKVASVRVQSFTRNAESIEALRSGNGHDDIRVRQQVATSIIDGDDALADVARAVGDDSRRGDADVSVPDLVWLCIPGDLYRLANGELANLRFVEVSVYLNLIQISDIDQVFAGRNEIIGGDGDRVNGACLRCPDVVGSITALRGRKCCPCIGNLCLDASLVGWAVALVSARLEALHGAGGCL